ncbi:MAG: ABC transporter permease subunit [Bacillota bacterium]
MNIKEKSKNITSNKIKKILFDNMVPILFIIVCLIGIQLSKLPIPFVVNELITRLARNSFVVLALIIPVIAGMGMNFAIVLGAMAGQIAVIAVTHWGVVGVPGLLLISGLTVPLAIVFGYLTGKLLNKTKGQEMVTSLMLGFFATGLYQLLFLFLVGTVIPMKNPVLVISGGIGIKNTIDLAGTIKYSLDNIVKWNLPQTLIYAGVAVTILLIIHLVYKIVVKKENVDLKKTCVNIILFAGAGALGFYMQQTKSRFGIVQIPVMTLATIAALCAFTTFIVKTKLGQQFRTVGQDKHIAEVSGIEVDKVRLIAIVISTVLAGWGQIIFLQNIGTLNTYGSHEQVGMFAVASILIGGASVTKATIWHALVGTLLFHTLFVVSPLAGKNLLGNAMVGEYFRVFVAYGVIGVSLGLHAWKKQFKKK